MIGTYFHRFSQFLDKIKMDQSNNNCHVPEGATVQGQGDATIHVPRGATVQGPGVVQFIVQGDA